MLHHARSILDSTILPARLAPEKEGALDTCARRHVGSAHVVDLLAALRVGDLPAGLAA